MIHVTHDQVEAMTLADIIVALRGGEVMQSGTPEELYERPANLFVAGFIGSPKMNLWRLEGPGKENGIFARAAERGSRLGRGQRPEHLVAVPLNEAESSNEGAGGGTPPASWSTPSTSEATSTSMCAAKAPGSSCFAPPSKTAPSKQATASPSASQKTASISSLPTREPWLSRSRGPLPLASLALSVR